MLPVAIVLATTLPWLIHAKLAAGEANTPADQMLLHDYGTALLREDPGNPQSAFAPVSEWRRRLAFNSTRLTAAVAEAFTGRKYVTIRLFLLGVLAFGFFRVVRRGMRIDDWFFIANLVVFLAYFNTDTRLLIPLAPFLYFYLAQVAIWIGRWQRLRSALPSSEFLVPLAFLLALGSLNVWRLSEEVGWELGGGKGAAARPTDNDRIGQWLRENTPSDAVILCLNAAPVAVRCGRRVYTYAFSHLQNRPMPSDLVTKYGVDYVVVEVPTPEVGSLPESIAGMERTIENLQRIVKEAPPADRWKIGSHRSRKRTIIVCRVSDG